LFYTSGSSVYGNEHKFGKPSSNFSLKPTHGEQFLTKYHGFSNISVITIPSQYYGEKIKEGSFKLIERSIEQTVDGAGTPALGENPVIVDDGFGNLYSTNAFRYLVPGSSPSSSDNYVGNIFYDKGIAVITETGSWSGSGGTSPANYSDMATNFNLQFDSHHTITTHEYNVTLLPQDYNLTTNYSIRNVLTTDTEPLKLSTPFIATTFTGSDWQPYITTINLYQDGDYDSPIITAALPRPIKKSDKINTRFKIRLDI
jgi:hypothetical protein